MSYPNKQSPEQWAAQLDFAGLEKQYGLPAGVLTNLVRQESGGNCSAVSPVGAKGLCQFMPKTAAGLGVDASDPASSAKGAAKYLEHLMDMYGGDIDKAIAAYNCGPGNVNKAVKAGGTDWRAHLPNETKKYLAIVGKGIGKSYNERAADGTLSDEDKDAEAARRREELKDLGYKGPEMGMKDLFGQMFIAVLVSLLKPMMDKMQGAPGPDAVAPQSLSNGTTVAPTPTPAAVNTTPDKAPTPVKPVSAAAR